MTNLQTISNDLAQLVDTAAPSVVQVIGARRPASGVVHGPDTIITTARAIGREDGLRVRVNGADAEAIQADLAGWDPATGLAVLRTRSAINVSPLTVAPAEPRVGEIVVAIARSWSNAVTASVGIVAIVGGPLRTGRRRQIARVFRMTAPLHDGFAGGGVFDTSGRLTGMATATSIRGFGVGIPAGIAWPAASQLLTTGTPRRGFIGVAVQPVKLPVAQRPEGRERALLVMNVSSSSPAEKAGLMVGDILLAFDGQPTESADDLLERLAATAIGQDVVARTLRGGDAREVRLTIAEHPRR